MGIKTNKIILTIVALLMLTVAACVSSAPATERSDSARTVAPIAGLVDQDLTATASPTTIAAQATAATVTLNTSYENAVSVEYQLLLGTLSLTGDLVVTDKQASVLLPLWNELKTISTNMGPGQGAPGQSQANATPQPQGSDTKTQAQIDALVEQIMAAMTDEQIETIAAMQITRDSAMTIMQAHGLTMGGGNGNPPPGGGQPPSGTPPAGGEQPPSGRQPPSGTPPAGGGPMAGPSGGSMIPPELFDVLIRALGGDPSAAAPAPSASGRSGGATGLSSSMSAAYT